MTANCILSSATTGFVGAGLAAGTYCNSTYRQMLMRYQQSLLTKYRGWLRRQDNTHQTFKLYTRKVGVVSWTAVKQECIVNRSLHHLSAKNGTIDDIQSYLCSIIVPPERW